ncbi:AI-2E family transporter [Roseibium sp.]|uniref:AI-2E family transporter n=1 Tax=Roseibium sp. TaxID=1936156 RepID=UPI003B51C063
MDNLTSPGQARFHTFVLSLVVLLVGALFFGLVYDYLITLFLAAIFSALAAPVYRTFFNLTGNRKNTSVALTLILLSVCVLLPSAAILVLGVQQAANVASEVSAWIERIDLAAMQRSAPDWLPFKFDLIELSATIATKAAEAAGQIANFFVGVLSQATKGTAFFFLNLFILIYAMVFFLPQNPNMLRQLLGHSGLPLDVQETLSERIISISRATIKGTFLIGIVQGVLGGIGFWLFGLSGGAFWGCVMAILSVIPGVGPPLVLIPGIVVLAAAGEIGNAIGLTLWTALVVTTVDNFLRPVLVGRDTKIPDLLVLISTFGGLAAFGAAGLILGPVIAGLFITVWRVFEDRLQAEGLQPKPMAAAAGSSPGTQVSDTVSAEIQELRAELEALREKDKAPN